MGIREIEPNCEQDQPWGAPLSSSSNASPPLEPTPSGSIRRIDAYPHLIDLARWLLWGVAWLLFLYFIFRIIGWIPAESQLCQYNDYTSKEHCVTYSTEYVLAIETARFLNYNAGAIAAIASVFVALFTWTLWRSTHLLWEVGREQHNAAMRQLAVATMSAEAAIGVEMPRMILTDVHMPTLLESPRKSLATDRLDISFKNHGRTSAELVAECFEWRVLVPEQLPSAPEYREGNIRPADLGTVVEAQADYTMMSPISGLYSGRGENLRHILDVEIDAVMAGTASLWVYGYIVYRDFLSWTHQVGFCTRLEIRRARQDERMIMMMRFVQGGPPACTYQIRHSERR